MRKPRIGPMAIRMLQDAADGRPVPKSHYGGGKFNASNCLSPLLVHGLIRWQDINVPYEDRLLVITDKGRAVAKAGSVQDC